MSQIFYVRIITEAYLEADSEEHARTLARAMNGGVCVDTVRPPQTVIGVFDRHALDGRNDEVKR